MDTVRLIGLLIATATVATAQSAPTPYFGIQVVDSQTGRGVPLVELETVHDVVYVTDSAGWAAVFEPGLMGQEVFFHVRSHGYEHPADGFGYRGFRVVLEPGGTITIRIERRNVAERLYRVTGQGIYRDSVLLGRPTPLRSPLLAGGVLGQDSVVNAVYRGRLFWFWGDTDRASYPLGNFAVSGAVSELPGRGGLDPAVGVDLDYFVDDTGFARRLCPIEGPGPVWIGGLMVCAVDDQDRLVCHYARMKDLGTMLEHGLAIWNDADEVFDKLVEFPLDAPLRPAGRPLRVHEDGQDWFYFPDPYPAVRVPASFDAIRDPAAYVAFSAGQWRSDGVASSSWKNLTDIETGERIRGHGGCVAWNAHRQRWVMIALQSHGRSMLGEVWFAEADTLLGPWSYARRVVSHDRYSFYNVAHHPWFDQDDGRLVYFEGTYTATFSGNERPTARYDYNQVMYRLDLDDPRLVLPVPVYRVASSNGVRWSTGRAMSDAEWGDVTGVPFYALPPTTDLSAAVPVVDPDGVVRFGLVAPAAPDARFQVPIHEWRRETGDAVEYWPADQQPAGTGWRRGDAPIGWAWRSPNPDPPLSPRATPAR